MKQIVHLNADKMLTPIDFILNKIDTCTQAMRESPSNLSSDQICGTDKTHNFGKFYTKMLNNVNR